MLLLHSLSGQATSTKEASLAEIRAIQMLANSLADAVNDAIHFNSVSE